MADAEGNLAAPHSTPVADVLKFYGVQVEAPHTHFSAASDAVRPVRGVPRPAPRAGCPDAVSACARGPRGASKYYGAHQLTA